MKYLFTVNLKSKMFYHNTHSHLPNSSSNAMECCILSGAHPGSTVWSVQVQFIVIITCHGIENAYLHTSMAWMGMWMPSIRSLAHRMLAEMGGSGIINCLQHISMCRCKSGPHRAWPSTAKQLNNLMLGKVSHPE